MHYVVEGRGAGAQIPRGPALPANVVEQSRAPCIKASQTVHDHADVEEKPMVTLALCAWSSMP
jgi:hypothetical protein